MPLKDKPNRKPNVLLIVTDQQRADLIGAFGKVPVKTPALDRLCAEGTAFQRAYTATPLCTPSRATLLSGQYASRHRAWSIGVDTPDNILSLPALLKEQAGYRTGIIGKSHFKSCGREDSFEAIPHSQDWDFFRSWHGPWFGFEYAKINVGHVYEQHAYSMHYGAWLKEQGYENTPPYFSEQRREGIGSPDGRWMLPEEAHSSKWVADETIDYLNQHADAGGERPFFLSVNFPDPHPPFLVSEPWNAMYEDAVLPPPVRRMGEWENKPTLYRSTIDQTVHDLGWNDHALVPGQHSFGASNEERTQEEERKWRTYMGMQSLLDKHLGRILDTLDELGFAQDTLVIYTSDHGDYMGDHFLWSKGGSHYDAAVRVPFIVRWPGEIPVGQQRDDLQSLVDVAPTIMHAAGLTPHPEMQGRNQLPSWGGAQIADVPPTRSGVLIDHRVERGIYVNSWITERYRLSVHSILAEARDEMELYDLQLDSDELRNLAYDPAYSGLVTELMQQLLRYRMEMQGPWSERLTFA